MDLFKNPFNILAASPRDDRRRIAALAEERSLLQDPEECSDARSNLTNPRKRLTAEVSWLPGIGPKRAFELVQRIQQSPRDAYGENTIPSLAKANLLASALPHVSRFSAEELADWILAIAYLFDDLEIEETVTLLNEERLVSGFPEISDHNAVESELNDRRLYFKSAIKSALDELDPRSLIEAVTRSVEESTGLGEDHAPTIIYDLVDAYEVEVQGVLEKEHSSISTLVEKIREAVESEKADSYVQPLINQLLKVVRNWDLFAQPIQVSTKSRGLDHDASHRVAAEVRSLAIELFNEHGKLEYSQQITEMLQDVFAEVVSVAERTAEDADALEGIAEERLRMVSRVQEEADDWRREISYSAEVGVMFKDRLAISPEGIEWKGRNWPLESISKIRWGGTSHSINGIPTGTTYTITFGTASAVVTVELRKKSTYQNFIERLWKAVGVRILTELIESLKNGNSHRFGACRVFDSGCELVRKKFFGSDERVFVSWNEALIWNGAGSFCIGKKGDKKLIAAISYQDEDNVHVLEAVVRMLFKKGGPKLSGILE